MYSPLELKLMTVIVLMCLSVRLMNSGSCVQYESRLVYGKQKTARVDK